MVDLSPDSSIPLTERDRGILAQKDEDYHLLTWDDLKAIIGDNALDKLTRLPSHLRRYRVWSAEVNAEYGNMTNFILQERLYWTPQKSEDPSAPPIIPSKSPLAFAERSDYRILINDWPYAMVPGIKHICVWLKVRIPANNINGDLSSEGRKMVDDFVDKVFTKALGIEGQDRVLWFKNWPGIQSVRALEHIHVLLRGVDDDALAKIVEKPTA